MVLLHAEFIINDLYAFLLELTLQRTIKIDSNCHCLTEGVLWCLIRMIYIISVQLGYAFCKSAKSLEQIYIKNVNVPITSTIKFY